MNLLRLTVLPLFDFSSKEFSINEPYTNEVFNPEEMKTIHGKSINIEDPQNLLGTIEMGFAVVVPEEFNGRDESSSYQMDFDSSFVGYLYVPRRVKADFLRINEIDNEEEFNTVKEKVENAYIPVFSVFKVNPDDADTLSTEAQHKELFEHIQPVCVHGSDKIYMAYNSDFAAHELDGDEKKALADFVAQMIERVKTGLMLFPPQDFIEYYGPDEEELELDGGLDDFATADLYGQAFDPQELSRYDLNVVNIWSSGCGPCIAEMPDLQLLMENLPGNINFFTICLDGDANNQQARDVVESVNATFRTLKGDVLHEGVLKNVTGTPTTLFLDSEGKMVGDAIVGRMASEKKFVSGSMKIIEERLAMME